MHIIFQVGCWILETKQWGKVLASMEVAVYTGNRCKSNNKNGHQIVLAVSPMKEDSLVL